MGQKQKINDYGELNLIGEVMPYLEKRMAYNGSNLEYVGYNRRQNETTDADTWYIVKLEYSGSNVIRYRLPDDGPQFKYVWDDRATYFA